VKEVNQEQTGEDVADEMNPEVDTQVGRRTVHLPSVYTVASPGESLNTKPPY